MIAVDRELEERVNSTTTQLFTIHSEQLSAKGSGKDTVTTTYLNRWPAKNYNWHCKTDKRTKVTAKSPNLGNQVCEGDKKVREQCY